MAFVPTKSVDDVYAPTTAGGAPRGASMLDALTYHKEFQLYVEEKAAFARDTLPAATTYYVRSDGSDSNDGLTNTAGGAFKTLARAWTIIKTSVDSAGKVIAIQLGDGTFDGVTIDAPIPGGGVLYIKGNPTNPENVVVAGTNANGIAASNGAYIIVQDFEVRTTGAGDGLVAFHGSRITHSNMRFGDCDDAQIHADTNSRIDSIGNYAIVGSAISHIHATSNARVSVLSGTITLVGTPAFGAYFCGVAGNALVSIQGITWSGAATGKKFVAHKGAIIDCFGQPRDYLPGSIAGDTLSGGLYLGSEYVDKQESFYVLAASAVPVSLTGTTSLTTLATVTVPAGALGANGILRIKTRWSMTNNANGKSMVVKFGTTNFMNIAAPSNASAQYMTFIQNRDDPAIQVGHAAGAPSFGAAAAAPVSAAHDTSLNQNIQIQGILANAADTLTLEDYCIELFHQE